MQSILSLDVSTQPARLHLVQVDGHNLHLLQTTELNLGDLFSREQLLHAVSSNALEANQGPAPNPGEAGTNGHPPQTTAPAETAADSPAGSPSELQTFRQALASMGVWTNMILIVPAWDYLSINLNLPFGDDRSISRIIDLEVQDRIPFDLNEFLLEYRRLGKFADKNFDVHVGLIPKSYIANVLLHCRSVDLEPYIITTPASVLESLFHIAPDYMSDDSAIVLARDPDYYIAVHVDGSLRVDRSLVRPQGSASDDGKRAVLTDLKLTLSVAETRYQKTIEKLYLLGDAISSDQLQQVMGRNVESLSLSQLLPASEGKADLASLAALFAQDFFKSAILSNFRVREFVYSPRMRELLEGLKRLLPYFLLTILSLIVALTSFYYSREREIHRLRGAMQQTLGPILGGVQLQPGSEVKEILAQNEKLETDLERLGSPSKYSPLDAFVEVTSDFHTLPGVVIRSLTIRGNRIKVEGTGSSYSDVDKIEKLLRSKKEVYCRIPNPETSRRAASTLGFVFDIFVCE